MTIKNLFNEMLQESMLNKTFLEIYHEENDDKFEVGYVLAIFDDSILIHSVDKYGNEDGYCSIFLKNIYKIGKNTKYIENLMIDLLNAKSSLHQLLIKYISQKENCLLAIIEFCAINNILLNITLNNDVVINGLIKQFDNDSLIIDSLFDDGSYEGQYLVNLSDISSTEFESKSEKKIDRLRKAIK